MVAIGYAAKLTGHTTLMFAPFAVAILVTLASVLLMWSHRKHITGNLFEVIEFIRSFMFDHGESR